jgi:threonine aldolase
MMAAIATAELGDDVWEDDPTVNRLQELAAGMLGMEAALFVPSGTMGNLIAALVHCRRGEELIVGDKAHVFCCEAGNVSAIGGIHPYVLPNQPDGTLDLGMIEDAIRVDDVHFPRTAAVTLENTHNGCGGLAIPPAYFADVRRLADRYGLMIHLDGARIFNAAVALDVPVQEFTRHVDSVMTCLSKGLCAPVGSVLAGSRGFVAQARRVRKVLGGGMRQAGILAAAGIVALEQMVDRLAEDHANASRLAEGLCHIPGVRVPSLPLPPDAVTTNMVYFDLQESAPIEPQTFVQRLASDYDIILEPGFSRSYRLVTHYWVTADDVERTLTAFEEILGRP